MAKLTSRVRAQAQDVYTLTIELQVRLRVLEEAHATLDIQVKPGRSTASGAITDSETTDIEPLAFIVMMQASKSAQDDLKEIMAGVKEINRAKSLLRDERQPGHRPGLDFEAILQLMLVAYSKQIDAEAEILLSKLDSMSEMGDGKPAPANGDGSCG